MDNKIALITGANSGIGLATAKLFLSKGMHVIINYIDKEDCIDDLIHSLKGEYISTVVAIKADVSNHDERKKLIESVFDTFGRLDILINNAGITNYEFNFPDITLGGFKETMAVNLEAAVFLSKLFADELIKRKLAGCIINNASVTGYRGSENIHYGASKAALINITKTIARKLAKYNIRANSISPGFVLTDMSKEWRKKNPESWNKIIEEIPMRCAATPESVAKAIYFLASDEAQMITGVDLPIDGGFLS
jgi:NAD(P)-dependent dehydrogenase (short-subunit alcohol dehydrogenase family)